MKKEKKTNVLISILKPMLLIVSTVLFFTVKNSRLRKKN